MDDKTNQEIGKSIKEKDYNKFIKQIVVLSNKVLDTVEKFSESFSFFSSIIYVLGVQKDFEAIYDQLEKCILLEGVKEKEGRERVNLMLELHGQLKKELKFKSFIGMINYAIKLNIEKKCFPFIFDRKAKLEFLKSQSPEEIKEFFELIKEVLLKEKEQFIALGIEYLKLREDEDVLGQIIVECINLADFHSLKTISTVLEERIKNIKNQKLSSLFEIFLNQDYKDYNKFHADNKDYLKQIGLDVPETAATIKLFSMCNLFSKNIENKLTFEEIIKSFEFKDETEMEYELIRGKTCRIFDIRINEVNKTVEILSSSFRPFKKENWTEVKTKIDSLKTRIADFLEKK